MPALPPKTASFTGAFVQDWKLVPLYQSAVLVFHVPVPPPPGVTPLGDHSKEAALPARGPAIQKAIAIVPNRRHRRANKAKPTVRMAAMASWTFFVQANRDARTPSLARLLLACSSPPFARPRNGCLGPRNSSFPPFPESPSAICGGEWREITAQSHFDEVCSADVTFFVQGFLGRELTRVQRVRPKIIMAKPERRPVGQVANSGGRAAAPKGPRLAGTRTPIAGIGC